MDRGKRLEVAQSAGLRTWGRGRAVRLPPEAYAGATPVHLTICADAECPFDDADVASMVCESVEISARLLGHQLYVYCLMPDHLHVMIGASDSGQSVLRFLQKVKSFTTARYRAMTGRARLWQPSARDRLKRDGEVVMTLVAYIANNPVRRGLVARWDDWPHTRIFVDV